ncbi:hypothetical protein C2L65_25640 [Paraburkholderia terrae]|uniref:Uncharacterized protein n=1 Tax=Paraburkholderia terrae TaxID=311230 RepID=A0A2I8ETY2_9BURK|nr:hypothetical protein C2L65_25640 [Paraburkholderia terrae]
MLDEAGTRYAVSFVRKVFVRRKRCDSRRANAYETACESSCLTAKVNCTMAFKMRTSRTFFHGWVLCGPRVPAVQTFALGCVEGSPELIDAERNEIV